MYLIKLDGDVTQFRDREEVLTLVGLLNLKKFFGRYCFRMFVTLFVRVKNKGQGSMAFVDFGLRRAFVQIENGTS
jgi:hypothetical protein